MNSHHHVEESLTGKLDSLREEKEARCAERNGALGGFMAVTQRLASKAAEREQLDAESRDLDHDKHEIAEEMLLLQNERNQFQETLQELTKKIAVIDSHTQAVSDLLARHRRNKKT